MAKGWLAILSVAVATAFSVGCVTRTETYSIVVKMPARKVSGPLDSVAVLDFASNRVGWGARASQAIRSGLTQEGHVAIVQQAAQYVLSGAVSVGRAKASTDHKSRRIEYTEDGRKRTKIIHTYTFRKELASSLTYELRRGSEIIVADTHLLHYDQAWARDSSQAARDAAPDDDAIIAAQIDMMARSVVFDISPHEEKRTLDLEMGSHGGFRHGMTYLKHGREDQAMAIWKQVADQATEPEEQASALYNIAIILEAQKDYVAAFDLLSRADYLNPGRERYIKAMTRVERAKLEQEAVARQTRER